MSSKRKSDRERNVAPLVVREVGFAARMYDPAHHQPVSGRDVGNAPPAVLRRLGVRRSQGDQHHQGDPAARQAAHALEIGSRCGCGHMMMRLPRMKTPPPIQIQLTRGLR